MLKKKRERKRKHHLFFLIFDVLSTGTEAEIAYHNLSEESTGSNETEQDPRHVRQAWRTRTCRNAAGRCNRYRSRCSERVKHKTSSECLQCLALTLSALVEFLEPSEARKAFMRLAYTKYKHLPLYLEWAPDNSFTTPASKTNASTREASKSTTDCAGVTEEVAIRESRKENANDAKERDDTEDEEDEEVEPDTTLFVKNINFSTTTEQLKDVSSWKLL